MGPGPAGRAWRAPALRLEGIWRAASATAAVAGRIDDFLDALLASLPESLSRPTDQLLDQALARIAARIDWSAVGAPTAGRWRSWAQALGSDQYPTLSGAVRVGLFSVDQASALSSRELSLDAIADALNLIIAGQATNLLVDAATASAYVAERLNSIRSSAAGGAHGFGAVPAAELAAGLAIHAGQAELWVELADFLSDTAVGRHEKGPTFDRLASDIGVVPKRVLQEIRPVVQALVEQSAADPFSAEVRSPFPPALRFAIVGELLDEQDSFSYVSELLGSRDSGTRAEGVRTLRLLARQEKAPLWVVGLCLQMTKDMVGEVRAEAGRAVATLLLRPDQGQRGILEHAILTLIDADGLLVPLLTLRGLTETGLPAEGRVRQRVAEVAANHIAFGVRLQATAALSK